MIQVADLHCDTVGELRGGADLLGGNPAGHVDLPRLRRGGVGLQVFACYVSSALPAARAWPETLAMLDAIDGLVAAGRSAATGTVWSRCAAAACAT